MSVTDGDTAFVVTLMEDVEKYSDDSCSLLLQ